MHNIHVILTNQNTSCNKAMQFIDEQLASIELDRSWDYHEVAGAININSGIYVSNGDNNNQIRMPKQLDIWVNSLFGHEMYTQLQKSLQSAISSQQWHSAYCICRELDGIKDAVLSGRMFCSEKNEMFEVNGNYFTYRGITDWRVPTLTSMPTIAVIVDFHS